MVLLVVGLLIIVRISRHLEEGTRPVANTVSVEPSPTISPDEEPKKSVIKYLTLYNEYYHNSDTKAESWQNTENDGEYMVSVEGPDSRQTTVTLKGDRHTFPTQYGVSFKVAYDGEAFENEVLKEAFIQKTTLFLLAPIEGDTAQEKVNQLTLAMGEEEEYQDVTHLFQKIQITPISKATFCFTIWYEWH